MTTPAPTVIVPSIDAGRCEAIVRSLRCQGLDHQAILVDNGSPDPARIEALRAAHPALEVIRFERNLGYSRAVNAAARRADGDVIVLVNDDCDLEPAFLGELVGALDPGAGAVMAAGVLRYAHDPAVIDSAGIEIDHTLLAFDYLNGEPLDAAASAPDPYGASGGAGAVDRDAFLDAGAFDEGIFAYLEDVDLALRLRQNGATCRLARRALGTHRHSATLGPGSARKDYLMGYGRGYLIRKWSVLSLRRVPGVLARELVTCAGQAVVDRNLGAVRGRARGYAAARRTFAYPDHARTLGRGDPAMRTLRRRAARRRRVRRAERTLRSP